MIVIEEKVFLNQIMQFFPLMKASDETRTVQAAHKLARNWATWYRWHMTLKRPFQKRCKFNIMWGSCTIEVSKMLSIYLHGYVQLGCLVHVHQHSTLFGTFFNNNEMKNEKMKHTYVYVYANYNIYLIWVAIQWLNNCYKFLWYDFDSR